MTLSLPLALSLPLSLPLWLAPAHAHVPFAEGLFTITEIHAGPAAAGGQWFEIRNNTAATQNLVEQQFVDTAGTTFVVTAAALVPAGATAILAAPDSPVSALLRLPEGFAFAPEAGRLAHVDLNGDVDIVAWDAAWTLPADSSISLTAPLLTNVWANDLAGNWCPLPATPAAENAPCPNADLDSDGDGLTPTAGDCDDSDPLIPAALDDLDADRRDDDCDGLRDEDGHDDDGDGFTEASGDCDDSRADIYPGATEQPDGRDNDCDGAPDDFDSDRDGASALDGDCDDLDPAVHPGAIEIPCDGTDQDCDGLDPGCDTGDTATDDTAPPDDTAPDDTGNTADTDTAPDDTAANHAKPPTGIAGPCCAHGGYAWFGMVGWVLIQILRIPISTSKR